MTQEIPQSVNGVRSGCRPPPFLTKTLIMVEDPETNCIISWNPSGTSFIIWDHLRFAKELLPKYFKHSNFSSFIYQLNNYGFKKIGLRQYEYESKWFQAGKPHLLMNMKRRTDGIGITTSPKSTKRQRKAAPMIVCSDNDDEKSRAVKELENLRESNYLIKMETEKLKQKKIELEDQFSYFIEQGKDMENKAQKLFIFLGTILNPSIVQQVIDNNSGGGEVEYGSHQNVKKMALIAPPNEAAAAEKVLNRSQDKVAPEKHRISSAIVNDDQEEQVLTAGGGRGDGKIGCNNNNNEVIKYWELDNFVFDEGYNNSGEEKEENSKMEMALDDIMMASKIVMEVEDVIAKEPITDMDDELNFQLWA